MDKEINRSINIVRHDNNNSSLDKPNQDRSSEIKSKEYIDKAKEIIGRKDYILADFCLNLAFLNDISLSEKIRGLAMKSFIYNINIDQNIVFSVVKKLIRIKKTNNIQEDMIPTLIRTYFRFCKMIEKDDNLLYLSITMMKNIYDLISNYNIKDNYQEVKDFETMALKRMQENVIYKLF